MNVTCPQCSTVFRVDPAKVPEQGVRARCSVCSGLIAVRRPAIAPATTSDAPPPVSRAPVAAPETPRAAPAPAPVVAAPPPRPEPPPPVAEPVRRPPEPGAYHEPQARPAPEPPPVRPAPPPPPPMAPVASAAAPTPVHTPAPERGHAQGARFSNPFLQQDPSTRARRLARALVSDLVVYYPEKRQRGLAEGNLKELFGEEIRKSWEEYSEQVGQDIATTTPYFTEALNEILAEGRPLFG